VQSRSTPFPVVFEVPCAPAYMPFMNVFCPVVGIFVCASRVMSNSNIPQCYDVCFDVFSGVMLPYGLDRCMKADSLFFHPVTIEVVRGDGGVNTDSVFF
jgi:hypothetical protein